MVVGSGKATLVYRGVTSLKAWTRQGLVGRIRGDGKGIEYLIPAPEENAVEPFAGKHQVLIEYRYQVDQITVSPDGAWAAYRSREGGVDEVWIASFPDFTSRRKVSGLGAAEEPSWTADGKELIFLQATDNGLRSVEVKTSLTPKGPASELGPPKPVGIPSGRALSNLNQRNYAISNDGKRFLIRESPEGERAETEQLYVVLNWSSLLKK
jgi:Tol biopolymer transport system component